MLGSRTDLHIFDAGSVNGTRYCNKIFLSYVRLFRGAMGLHFLFMDDNAPCHRTVAAEQLLESRRFANRTLPPVTIRELRLALQDEWAAMPQQLIDTLILSMGRRCETCLAVRGDHIPPTKDRMFLARHPSQGCFGLQSHCTPCYFFNQASFYPSDFSFTTRVLLETHLVILIPSQETRTSPKPAPSVQASGCSSLVVKVSDRSWLVTSSSPVPLKTRRVGKRCTSNLLKAQTSSRWCGGVNRRG
ncbi:transposable element Tcb2 transposase [Trichonephila clavipes]|nr:transposable element Tcb2 transposase [Trichonephila clavipes]